MLQLSHSEHVFWIRSRFFPVVRTAHAVTSRLLHLRRLHLVLFHHYIHHTPLPDAKELQWYVVVEEEHVVEELESLILEGVSAQLQHLQ